MRGHLSRFLMIFILCMLVFMLYIVPVSAVTLVDIEPCLACHAQNMMTTQGHSDAHVLQPPVAGSSCAACHTDNMADEHSLYINPGTGQPYDCDICHRADARAPVRSVIDAYKLNGTKAGCDDCHAGVAPDLSSYPNHNNLHNSVPPISGRRIAGPLPASAQITLTLRERALGRMD